MCANASCCCTFLESNTKAWTTAVNTSCQANWSYHDTQKVYTFVCIYIAQLQCKNSNKFTDSLQSWVLLIYLNRLCVSSVHKWTSSVVNPYLCDSGSTRDPSTVGTHHFPKGTNDVSSQCEAPIFCQDSWTKTWQPTAYLKFRPAHRHSAVYINIKKCNIGCCIKAMLTYGESKPWMTDTVSSFFWSTDLVEVIVTQG